MGYILPIQPFQSQQYAERMNSERKNFTYIDRVNRIRLQNEESEYWKDVLEEENKRRKDRLEEQFDERQNQAPPPPVKNGFIAPNPAEFSLDLAEIVGKGQAVNEYI